MMYFTEVKTLEELKKEYKRLVMLNHPDRGGDLETMQAINSEYDAVFARVKNIHVNKDGKQYEKETDEAVEYFRDLINQLVKMAGIYVEIIGCFVWVSGNTKEHKDELKKLGFRWHSTKKMWYLAPAGYHKKSRKNISIEDIRSMYGVKADFYGAAEYAIATL